MFFSDIHNHLLYNTDDGAKSFDEMVKMVSAAYNGGTRLICATPHFAPSDFGNNSLNAESAFNELSAYCKENYKDLTLLLGNELFCDGNEVQWLKEGYCRTLNNTRYVLAEYPFPEKEKVIIKSLEAILCAGYVPIIAHVERYNNLSLGAIRRLKEDGVLLQMNVKNYKTLDIGLNLRIKRLLSNRLADFISSDAHNLTTRPPLMGEYYKKISRKYGAPYAENIFCTNAKRLLTEEK